MFKFIFAIIILTSCALAVEKHNPKVYEEDAEEIIRIARQQSEEYQPPIFVYDRSTQPDLRKWRYYQQQQVDSKNMEKILQRLEAVNVFRNGHVRYRDQNQSKHETDKQPSESIPLEPRWKIVHPKFVNERQSDFTPSDLMKMQEEYGKRRVQRVPITTNKNPRRRIKKTKNNPVREEVSNNSTYKVEEADLDVEASEVKETYMPIQRQDQISVVLPTNLVPKAIYVNPNAIAGLVSANSDESPNNAGAQSYDQISQKDIDALNSLLGSTHNEQLNGLNQLLNSQSSQVIPNQLSSSHISGEIAPNYQNIQQAEGISPEVQKILQSKGQTFDQLQAQLDAVSQQEGARAIAAAHQKAVEYVQSQQRAIELADLEGRKAALEKIQGHNLQLAEPQPPQSLALTQAQLVLPQEEDNGQNQVVSQINEASVQDKADISQNIATNKEENTILHAQLQAQAYLQVASKNHGPGQQKETVPNTLNTQPHYTQTFVYPEVNHNGLNGINVHHQPLQEGSDPNGPHVQLQAQAYQNLAAKTYAQPSEDLQKLYVNPDNTQVQEQDVYQGEHDDEYAPKYSFGYRVMDYHTGTDYGHEETREGKITKGRYHVHLPDGRIQRVNYWADLSGYHAKVTYSDHARH